MSDADHIVVPFGWKRHIDSARSAVSYISPSGVTLSSIVEVFQYLEKDDTCKCGLSCPIHVPKVFSFNPDIETTYYNSEEWINYRNKSDNRMNKCLHWLKLRKVQRGKSKMSPPKPSSSEPPPKLLIIRKDGKLRSVIPDIASSSEKYKQHSGPNTCKRSSKSARTVLRKPNDVADLKLSLSSATASSSGTTPVISTLKSPLFEPTTAMSVSNNNVKSKLQWIKADFETPGNDAESDAELCFSPDFKQSPTTPLPQSLMCGFVLPPKAYGFDNGAKNIPVKSYGDGISRFGIHPNPDGNFSGMRPTYGYMSNSGYNPPNYLPGTIQTERLPQSNQVRHAPPTISGHPNFGGAALMEQVRQHNPMHIPSDDQRQLFGNDGAHILHQGPALLASQTGNVFKMASNAHAHATTVQQRPPLASPSLLNPVSPYNYQMSNNGMMAPLGSPGGTNPSPYSNRSQSRSSSVGTPALSPGGIWPGARNNVSDSSRPMSCSSSTATPGPDVSPGSGIAHWNGNVPNSASYPIRTPSCSYLPVVSPASVTSFPGRFPTLPSTYPRFPRDGASAVGASKFHQPPYPREYAASQRLRMHSQTCQQQQTQRFEGTSRLRHYGPTQSTFVSNTQFPVLMTGAPQQVSHKTAESPHPNDFRPTPPYCAPMMQPSRMGEPDAATQLKFPFNSNRFNPQGTQQEPCNIVQRQFGQQQWQYNTSMTPRQYFTQNAMRPRAPIMPSQRPRLRAPKRTRKRKPKNVQNKTEPPTDTSAIKTEFAELFDAQEFPGLIPTSELLLDDGKNDVATESMKFSAFNVIQEIPSSTYSPSLILPQGVETSSLSVSSDQLIGMNPSSSLQSQNSTNNETSLVEASPTDKTDCLERVVTTPPLPVLSPTWMLDNPESPEDDLLPVLEFGGAISSSLLSFNLVTSAVPSTVVSSVSDKGLNSVAMSLANSTSINSEKSSAVVCDEINLEIIPNSTPECNLSTSSIVKKETPTSATSSMQQIVAPSVFTMAAPSNILTHSSPSGMLAYGCATSSVSESLTSVSTTCMQNLQTAWSALVGIRGRSSGVTSLVSSSGALFHLPEISKPKQIQIQRKLSCQSLAGLPKSQSTNNRRRYFSEPWQSRMSTLTPNVVTSSSAYHISSDVTTQMDDRKGEVQQLKPPSPQLIVPVQVVSTMEWSEKNLISPKTKTSISNISKQQNLSETVICTNSIQQTSTITSMAETPSAKDPNLTVCLNTVDSTIGETLNVEDPDLSVCLNRTESIIEDKKHEDLCNQQNVEQPPTADVSMDDADPPAGINLPDDTVNLSSPTCRSVDPLSTSEAVHITVKKVVMKLVEDASSIALTQQCDYKEKLFETHDGHGSQSSPNHLPGYSVSQEISCSNVIDGQSAYKLDDSQTFGNEAKLHSSPLREQIDLPVANSVKISAKSIPAELDAFNISMQIGLDDLGKSKNIGTVFKNPVETSDEICPMMTEEKDKSSLPRSTNTFLQCDSSCGRIESDPSPITYDITSSLTLNSDFLGKLPDDSNTMNVCPPVFANIDDKSHGATCKSEDALCLPHDVQDSSRQRHSPTRKNESTCSPPFHSNDLESKSRSCMGKSERPLDMSFDVPNSKSLAYSPTAERIWVVLQHGKDTDSESLSYGSKIESTPDPPQSNLDSKSDSYSLTSKSESTGDLLQHSGDSEGESHSYMSKIETLLDPSQNIQGSQSESCSVMSKSDITQDCCSHDEYIQSKSLPASTSECTLDLPQDVQDPQSCPSFSFADKKDINPVSDSVSMGPSSLGVDVPIITNLESTSISNSENSMIDNDEKLQEIMSQSTDASHADVTTSQVSSGYSESVATRAINMPPEWTTTVIQQLSSYNRILKNLLVRQVNPTADITQLATEAPRCEAQQADVISALFSNTVPQITSAQIFHKAAIAMRSSTDLPVLPATDHKPALQLFDQPSTSQNVYSESQQCTSAVCRRPSPVQTPKLSLDGAKISDAMASPPDSSEVQNDNTKIAKSTRTSESSHQGLQVPIVSSSVKGTQEESNAAANYGLKPQDEVTTSAKSACQIGDGTTERRRGRSRTAAKKQVTKRQQPLEKAPVEKVPRRSTASGSSSQRSSQKQTRIVKNGDLIWGQMRGFPSWPGKVVKPSEVRGLQQRTPLSEGKVWVRWFGDHRVTQMNPADLVSMTEGLEAHHKSRLKGRTRTKKISAHLETAIQEAVDELEQQQGTSSRRFVEALQATPAPAVVKEQREKPKRGRKRKAV